MRIVSALKSSEGNPLISKKVILIWFIIGCFGLYYSRAALSIFTLGLPVLALIKYGRRDLFKRFVHSKASVALSAIFFIYLLSGLWSTNLTMWVERLNSNLAYIFIPIGVIGLGPFSKKMFHQLLLIFISISALSALIIGLDYLAHFDAYNNLYKVAKTIPTPILHVRYSFYIGLSALISMYLLFDKSDVLGQLLTRRVAWFFTILLSVFLHVLAVRTGLLMFYVSCLGMFVLYCFKLRSATPLIGIVLIMLITTFGSYKLFPSVKNKFHYMMYDINKRNSLEDRHKYSDVIRFASIHTGIEVFKKNPIVGTGVGDLKDEMNIVYDELYPDFPAGSRFHPISQYVFTLSAFGFIGFILFYGLLFYPFYTGGYKDYFYILIYAGTAATFLIESGIELQLGKIFFLTLLCLRINVKN